MYRFSKKTSFQYWKRYHFKNYSTLSSSSFLCRLTQYIHDSTNSHKIPTYLIQLLKMCIKKSFENEFENSFDIIFIFLFFFKFLFFFFFSDTNVTQSFRREFASRSSDDSSWKMFQRFRMPGSRDGERNRRIADIACMSIPSTVRMLWTTWMPVPSSLGATIDRL